jgi:hypothetical protein
MVSGPAQYRGADGPTLASSLIASAARALSRNGSASVDHQRGT